MRLMLHFARIYPRQSFWMLVALILAGIAEGIGLTALLPLLQNIVKVPIGPSGSPSAGSGLGETVTNILQSIGIPPTVGSLLLIILAGVFLKSTLLLLADRKVGYTLAQIATDLRLDLLRAILSTRWEYFLHQRIGSLANAVGTEVMRASAAYLYGAMTVALLIQCIVNFGVALLVSWKITLVYTAVCILIVLLLSSLVRRTKKAGRKQTHLLQSLLARLTDSLISLKPFKAMGREDLADELLSRDTLKLNKALRKQVLSKAALRGIQDPLLALLLIGGMYWGLVVWKIQLANVMMLILLMARLLSQAGKVQRQYQQMVTCDSAFWSLQAKITEAQVHKETLEGQLLPTLNHGVCLNGVSFTYGDRMILTDVSLEIRAGSFVSIVGPSGAGKTTLVDLVTGLFQPVQGQILIDDTPLDELDVKKWRNLIGYVPQETILLNDSILANVSLGMPGLGVEDVEYALRSADAWNFVAAMPDGVHSTVGERGAKLSGGQRQRIAIARALVHQPRLLILDEATSALDPETEAGICETLRKLRGQLTILAISHQSALVNAADQVYHISAGKVSLTSALEDRGNSIGDLDAAQAEPGGKV